MLNNGKPEPNRSFSIQSKVNANCGKSDQPKIDLHFNYWHIDSKYFKPSHNDRIYGEDKTRWEKTVSACQSGIYYIRSFIKEKDKGGFLDVGILVDNCQKLEEVELYIPFSVEQEKIFDLSNLLSDKNIAAGIFNEPLEVETRSNIYFYLKNMGKEGGTSTYCRVFRFSKSDVRHAFIDDDNFNIVTKRNSTSITIKTNKIEGFDKGDDRAYFRFRIFLPKTHSLVVGKHTLNNGFSSPRLENVHFIDFRFEETRNLPFWLIAKKGQKNNLVKRVDFLCVIDRDADFVEGNKDFNKIRLLEADVWDQYVRCDATVNLPEGLVIYHWKQKTGDDWEQKTGNHWKQKIGNHWKQKTGNKDHDCVVDFIAFLKVRHTKINKFSFAFYVLAVILLSCISELIANPVWKLLKSLFFMVRDSLLSMLEFVF